MIIIIIPLCELRSTPQINIKANNIQTIKISALNIKLAVFFIRSNKTCGIINQLVAYRHEKNLKNIYYT